MTSTVCLIAKNEERALAEWLAYQCVIGFDRIVVYDNGSTDATASIVATDLHRSKLTGTVVAVLNQINPGSTDFQVKVRLENPGDRLRPGMAVIGSVTLPPARGIAIPETAFIDDNHDSILVVGKDDTISTVHVVETIGDGKNSIVQGLASGTRVVSDGQTSVGDGQKVAVR